MDVVYQQCGGIDVHKKTAVACVAAPGPDGQRKKQVRPFGTTTEELLALGDWLGEWGVTHVVLESTGVYWKPLWNLLEEHFRLLLVNAQHVKAVPGRKTAVRDCEWLADLLRHGLLRPSFVPDRPQRELRELTWYRTTLIWERAAEVNRLQKALEGANIKLGDVASNVLGASGRAKLEALVAGQADPELLADLAKGRLREKRAALERALSARMGPHQRFLLREQLCHIDALDESIERVSAGIAERLRPFAVARSKGTYLAAQCRRLAARRGKQKAAMAVGHSILVIVYHLLAYGEVYSDLGANYFDERDRQMVERRLVRRLEGLGIQVELKPRGTSEQLVAAG
ncbi:MAG: IS110 family transposase [Chloroflexi bacterium]|nr:IS110 family transposase [Chloroflexota bacterium]